MMIQCTECKAELVSDRLEDHLRYVHPGPALCACGCGKPVRHVEAGFPPRYRRGHGWLHREARKRAEQALADFKATFHR